MKATLTIVHLHEDGKTHLCDCKTIEGETWTDSVVAASSVVKGFRWGKIISSVLLRENASPDHVTLAKCFQPGEFQNDS